MAVLFAEKVGTGIALDPGQSTEKIKGEDNMWREVYNVGSQYPKLVE